VKLVLFHKKFGLYEVKSHGHWEIEEFNLGAFPFNVSLNENKLAVTIIIFFNMRETHRSS
jgi:hypothetical protein